MGIDVSVERLRAFRPGRRAGEGEAMEVEWGTAPPEASVTALRERFGSGNVIAVSVDMAALFVKRIDLPPLSLEERRQLIAMDPQRYFPVRGEALVAGVRDDDLVVACSAHLFDGWMEALSPLGSIERVEPAAASLARHLAAEDIADCVLVMKGGSQREGAVAILEAGRIAGVRRCLPGGGDIVSLAASMSPGAGPYLLLPWDDELGDAFRSRFADARIAGVPAPPGAPDSFAGAHGAFLGLGQGPELTMETPALARRLASSARRRAVVQVAALVVAMGIFGWSLDQRREAVLQALEEEIAVQQADAEPVLALRDEAASVADEVAFLSREASSRPDPLAVLLEVSRVLPPEAYLTQLVASGDTWELNGLARDAARLVPTLEGSDQFTDVRFRTATTRVRVRNQDYESFSLELRHVPAS